MVKSLYYQHAVILKSTFISIISIRISFRVLSNAYIHTLQQRNGLATICSSNCSCFVIKGYSYQTIFSLHPPCLCRQTSLYNPLDKNTIALIIMFNQPLSNFYIVKIQVCSKIAFRATTLCSHTAFQLYYLVLHNRQESRLHKLSRTILIKFLQESISWHNCYISDQYTDQLI